MTFYSPFVRTVRNKLNGVLIFDLNLNNNLNIINQLASEHLYVFPRKTIAQKYLKGYSRYQSGFGSIELKISDRIWRLIDCSVNKNNVRQKVFS